MDPLRHLSNMIFRSGQVAPRACSYCSSRNSLCIVSAFSNSCGLCLRSARCCSFMLSSVPSWAHADVMTSTSELHSDLCRVVGILSQISVALDASFYPSDFPSVRILESSQGSRGSLLLPRNPHQGILPNGFLFPLLTRFPITASTLNSSIDVSDSSSPAGFNTET